MLFSHLDDSEDQFVLGLADAARRLKRGRKAQDGASARRLESTFDPKDVIVEPDETIQRLTRRAG